MNPDDFNDPDVRALAILIPQEIAAAEARGRKQAADDIAQQIKHSIDLDSPDLDPYRPGLWMALDIARAYAAGQDTG